MAFPVPQKLSYRIWHLIDVHILPQWTEVLPEDTACVWDGHFAILTGPFLEVQDDDGHTFRCGIPLEICSKTHRVLQHEAYQPYFGVINRATQPESHDAIICEPAGGCC